MISPVFAAIGGLRPRFSLDFAGTQLDPSISFSRSGNTATVVNANGYVSPVNADIPRFDYDPVTLTPRGLLIEEQRTNVLLNSNDFSQASWGKTALTVSACPDASPSGLTDAQTLTNSGGTGLVTAVFSGTAGLTYTFSVWMKRRTGTGTIFMVDANGVNVSQTLTSEWKRFVVTSTASTTTVRAYIRVVSPGDAIDAYGAQLEAGPSVTSYIPTTTTGVTRNPDVAVITGDAFDAFWRQGRGSALVYARPTTVLSTRPLIQFDDATADNIIALRGNAANPELYVITSGVDQAQVDAGTIAASMSYRLAGAWAADNCAASLNSGTPVLDGVATIPTVTQARLGSDGTNYLNGHIEAIEYYDERLPNSALQVLSGTAGYQSIIGSVFRDATIS